MPRFARAHRRGQFGGAVGSGGGTSKNGTIMSTVIVTLAMSPYTPPPNTSMLVKSSQGAITILLPASSLGAIFEVDDYDQNAAANNITVTPPVGWKLEDPNAQGAYLGTNATCALSINGGSATWRLDGTALCKII